MNKFILIVVFINLFNNCYAKNNIKKIKNISNIYLNSITKYEFGKNLDKYYSKEMMWRPSSDADLRHEHDLAIIIENYKIKKIEFLNDKQEAKVHIILYQIAKVTSKKYKSNLIKKVPIFFLVKKESNNWKIYSEPFFDF